jgi:pimeloyl-ACP methyl ester carboxylesterase
MSIYASTPTKTVTAENGVTYAYRRQGPAADRPLVLLQHFRGNLDNWDPALIDALSEDREVITFDNEGVGATTGPTPATVAAMAHGALEFIEALELEEIDLLGFSIGSFVAQEIALVRPSLLHRLVLASAAPQGAPGMHGWVKDIIDAVGSKTSGAKDLLYAFFRASQTSQMAGMEFLQRFSERAEDRDADTTWQTRNAHYDAVVAWGEPNTALLERLAAITVPVLITNGDTDNMILPRYSYLLAGMIDGALIKIYPDSAHGFLFQHHTEFSRDVRTFVDTGALPA